MTCVARSQQQQHEQGELEPAAFPASRRQLLAAAASLAAAAALPAPPAAAENVIDGQGKTFLLPFSAVDDFTAAQKQILEYNLRTQRQNNAPPDFPAFVREGYDMTGGLRVLVVARPHGCHVSPRLSLVQRRGTSRAMCAAVHRALSQLPCPQCWATASRCRPTASSTKTLWRGRETSPRTGR